MEQTAVRKEAALQEQALAFAGLRLTAAARLIGPEWK
jgi:hypothetical protein